MINEKHRASLIVYFRWAVTKYFDLWYVFCVIQELWIDNLLLSNLLFLGPCLTMTSRSTRCSVRPFSSLVASEPTSGSPMQQADKPIPAAQEEISLLTMTTICTTKNSTPVFLVYMHSVWKCDNVYLVFLWFLDYSN